MKLSALKINPKNPRTITEAKVQELKESLEDFPKIMGLQGSN